jgi:hypothetical protein
MATQSPLTPASTIGAYGVQPEKLSDYDKALEDSIKALEQRYASPNYFNVAAGFFKPQLGGFAASLGSAAQALGENVEKERESQLPVAKMRAELALSRINMGKEKDAAAAFSTWKASKLPMDEATYAHIVGLSPNSSVAAAAKAAYEGERAGQSLTTQQQQLRSSQYAQALTAAQQKFASGAISRDAYVSALDAAEQAYGPTQPVKPTRPVDAPGTAFPAAAATPAAAPAVAPAATPTAAAGSTELPPGDLNTLVDLLGGSTANGPAVKGGAVAAANRGDATVDSAGNPIAGAKPAAKPTQKVVITSPFASNEMGLTPEALAAQVASNETAAKTKFDALDKVAGPDNYKPARRVIEDQISLIKNNPELAKRVTAILSRGDLASQIKTALEEGIGLNLGGIAGQIKLPIKKVEIAGFSKRDQELAQTMANNYAKIAVFQQRIGNVNPNAASNMEAQMYKDLTPTMDTTPNAALRALGHLQTDLDATHARYNFANEVYRGRHPDVSVAKNVPDRWSAILSHPTYDAVYDPFGKDHKALEDAFQRRLASTTKKP